jgi:para-aminobenzoate synthetase component 1
MIPLVEELPPTLDPWRAFRALAHLPHVLFLDSSASHPTLGRYSFLAAEPFSLLVYAAGKLRWQSELLDAWPDASLTQQEEPLTVLRQCMERFRLDTLPGLPPWQGGIAGLWSYDFCHHLEKLPRHRVDEFALPDLVLGLYDWVLAWDHSTGEAWMVSTGWPETKPYLQKQRAAQRLKSVWRWLNTADPPQERWRGERLMDRAELVPQYPLPQLPHLTSNFRREDYLAAVDKAIAYIHAGDAFQINLAQRLLLPQTLSPLAVYERLREVTPATFGGYFDLGEYALASSTPERFVQMGSSGALETRPIKGTRPRGKTPTEDEQFRQELQASAKDRAENVMIVDLLRNDLGRVAEYGSVQVPELCNIESNAAVHHLVSVVTAQKRPSLSAVDVLQAVFPGGSVTGAPKIRAMEIIAELEPTARGVYCGSLGYLGFDGAMDTNILIRTLTMGRGWMQFPVGGGIVADSVPEAEYAETLHKAGGMLRALE